MFLPVFPALEHGKQAYSVNVITDFLSVDLAEGRHNVPERADEIGLGAPVDVAFPFDNERDTYSSLIDIPLVSAPRPVGVEKVGIGTALEMRAVV